MPSYFYNDNKRKKMKIFHEEDHFSNIANI